MHVVFTSRLTGLALLCALLAATIIAPDALRAQPTGFAAGQLILQDTSGHSITLQPPAGLTASYNYILPASPGADIPAGFVAAGAYLGQTLYWNGTYWQPTTFVHFNGDALGLGFDAQPTALPFPVTLNADLGPATDYQHDLGDPTHRFRNIYAQAIIGPDGLSNAAQFSAITSGTNDNAAMYVATGASIVANGGIVQATAFKGAQSTTDAVDLATTEVSGVLSIANGGTGATTATDALNNLLPNQVGKAGYVLKTDGANASWVSSGGSGSVTSVGLSAPPEFTVSGSPITSSGTLTLTKAIQSANTVYAGPTNGVAAPSFRTLVAADIPDNNANTTGTAANVIGVVAVVNGGTGANTATSGRTNLGAAASGANNDITSLTGLTTALPIVEGGTGSTTAAGSRANLGAAARGANADISSLNGLTTALPISEGGTGSTSQAGARTSLGAAMSGANTDITSLNGLTTALSISEGGTGATTASSGRANLGAAASGANGDITSLTGLTTALPVSEGGTGSTSQSGARTNLGAAASGANTDITSLDGLTTALAVSEGGTGATTASSGRANLGAAARGANGDITSLAGLTTALPVSEGGTGASSASSARSNLGAAASGANSDITSLTALTTALPISEGGTGLTTLVGANRLIYSTAATTLTTLAPGNPNDVLTLDATGVPKWSTPTATSTIAFDNVTAGTNTSTLTVGSGGSILLGGGAIEASKLKGSGSTTDAVDLATAEVAGTLSIANGGTGATTQSAAINNLLPSQSSNATKVLQTDGSNVSWASVGTGTVTSVAIAAPAEFTVSGSPITNSGTLTLTKANQLANTVYAGPSEGSASAPGFRALVSADIPDNAANTTGSSANVTGLVQVAHGGTGATSASANTFFAAPDGLAGAPGFRAIVATDLPSLAANYIVNNTAQQSGAHFNIDGSGAIGTTLQIGPSALDANDEVAISKSGSTTTGGIGIIAGDAGVSIGSRTSGKELRLFATGSAPVTAYTNGIERVRIDGAGNLGVGTPSPSELVEVKDGNLLLSNSGTAGMLELQGTSSGVSTLTAGAQGTTTIHYTLPTSAPSANDVLTATSVSGSGTYAVTLGWSASSGVGSGWGLSGNAITSGQVLGTTNAQDLALETNSSERLRVTSAGAVGIGTPSPNQKLEVKNGNVLLSNTGTAAQIQLQGTGSGTTSLQAGAQGATNITYTLPTSQGVNGSILQNNGSGTLSWSRVGQVLFGRRTENFNVTSTSLQSDTSLVVTLDTNAIYTFQALLSVSDPNAGGVSYRYAFSVPTGATLKWGYSDPASGLSTNPSIRSGTNTETMTLSLNGANEEYYPVTGIVVTGSTPGSLQFRLRKFGGGLVSDPVRLNINSYLQVTRVR